MHRFDVVFPAPAFGSRSTHWKWNGRGQLVIDGPRTTLTGGRRRPFWFAAAQTVEIRTEQIRDVQRKEREISCTVDLEERTPEPLALCFATDAEAQEVERLWPDTQSVESRESRAFEIDLAKSGTKVRVTPVLIGTCLLVFALLATQGIPIFAPQGPEMIPWGTNFGPLTLEGQSWRLLTAIFLHFGLMHLALNMWALASMGPLVERLLGSARFAILYVVAGLGGSVASVTWNPDVNSAGASGAIFGVMGALVALMLNPRTRIPPSVARPQRNSAMFFIGYNVLNGLTHQGIDNAAHLGGLACGIAIGWALAVPIGAPPPRSAGRRPAAALAAILALLGFVLYREMHPGGAEVERRVLVKEIQVYVEIEERAIAQMNEYANQQQQKRITPAEAATLMESKVKPMWEEANDVVMAMQQHATGPRREALEKLQRYSQGRVLQMDLLAEAIREGSEEKTLWLTSHVQKVNRHAEEAGEALKILNP